MKALRVLYVASDLAPLTGNGHFAKEVHFLTRAMASLGLDISVAVPGHRADTPTAFGIARRLTPLLVNTANAPFEATVHEGNLAGGRVKVFVLDLPGQDESKDSTTRPGIHTEALTDAFCRAALALAAQEGLHPDVICAGPGTEPVLALAKASAGPDQRPPQTIYALRDLDDHAAVAAAVPHADHVVVSSPTLAATLRALPDSDPLGRLLAPVRSVIHGIVPGIDSVTWNPQYDRMAAAEVRADKAARKRQLKQRLDLRGGAQMPLIALIGPFDDQVLTEPALRALTESNALVVLLGDAERDGNACHRIESLMRPGHGAIQLGHGEQELLALEQELLGAADFAMFARAFSLTAPCELYPMHYGVVPIAPALAGYTDLLVEFDRRTATGSGFLFDPAEETQAGAAIARALRAYHQPESFAVLVERLIRFDLSWRTSAVRYSDLIRPKASPAQAEDVAAAAAPAAEVV